MTRIILILIISNYPIILSGQSNINEIDIWDYHIIEHTLVVSSQNAPVFKIIDLEKNKQVASFGNLGRGPGEIHMPGFFNIKKIDNDIIKIYYVEFQINILKSFLFNIKNLTATANENIELPRDFTGLFSEQIIADSLLIGSYDDFFDKRRHGMRSVIIHNINKNIFDEILLYKIKSKPFNFSTELNINARDLLYDSENKQIITLTLASNIVESINIYSIISKTFYLQADTALLTNIDPAVFNSDIYLDMYSQIGKIGNTFFTLQNKKDNDIAKNIINLYNENFELLNTIELEIGFHFNLARTYELNNSIILYGYEGDGFYELPIIDGELGKLKPLAINL